MKFGNTEIYYYFCEEFTCAVLAWVNLLILDDKEEKQKSNI